MYPRIKQTRQELKLSQKTIAEMLKTTRQHYACYENGQVEMPLFQFHNICIALNVSADYLLGLSDIKERR